MFKSPPIERKIWNFGNTNVFDHCWTLNFSKSQDKRSPGNSREKNRSEGSQVGVHFQR
jgi:hypothetical protein